MTGEEAKRELETLRRLSDIEDAHARADRVLCELLCEIGYDDVVELWRQVPKWYA